MKIKDGFILREVAGNFIVVAVGEEAVNFDAMITLNDTGAFLWKALENDTTKDKLVSAFLEEYDIDMDTANTDIDEFLEKLQSKGLLI